MSFGTALTGLSAAADALNATGNNISNASTVGFKQSRAEFGSIYATAYGGTSKLSTGTGVQLQAVSQEFTQGTLQTTGNNMDVAINGQGFLIYNDNGKQVYSRAGSLQVNNQGYVVNPLGQKLQVYPPVTNSSGQTTFNQGTLSSLQLNNSLGTPQATSQIKAQLNLNANASVLGAGQINTSDPTTYTYSTPVTIYDSLGAAHTATMYFRKVSSTAASGTTPGSTTWDVLTQVDGNTVNPSSNADPAYTSQAQLTFNGSGTLTSPTNGTISYNSYDPTNGSAPITMSLDLNGTTMVGSSSSVNNLIQNGYTSGQLSGVSINQSGIIQANYTNGQSQDLGQIALANFNNPQGLQQLGNTEWAQSSSSGSVLLGVAGSSNLGSIQSGALENSNVNLSNELVSLITEQRNYQANAKIISTEQTINQSIINIP